jgi:hypothetical protein
MRLRIVIRILIVLTLLPIIVWAVFGPGMRFYLSRNGMRIIEDIKIRSDDHVLIGSLSGDLWSGVKAERVAVYSDKDPAHLPLLEADTIILRFSLLDLIRGQTTPGSIHIKGFNSSVHIAADGTIALPEWKFRTAMQSQSSYRAGFDGGAAGSAGLRGIRITCEDGVLEIHKRFPMLTESVDVELTQLEGRGEFRMDEGLNIDGIHGKYLTSDVTLEGFVPLDENEPMDLSASMSDTLLDSVFRDIDPLFRGSAYLPSGTANGTVHVAGARDNLTVNGAIELTESVLGNVKIDAADAQVAYSAGLIDLTQVMVQAYGGTAEATARINLLGEKPLWNAVSTFESINLPDYLDSNGYYTYEATGLFSGTLEARGDFDSADSLDCSIEIECGTGSYLTPFSDRFMSRMTGATGDAEITEGDLAVFNELSVLARIEESTIYVDRFHFVSNDLQVEATGQVGFDKSIHASGMLSVPLDKAKEHPRLGRYVSFLADSINRVPLEFSISGYLYDLDFNPRITDNFLRGLADHGEDFLHDIGESVSGNL